jgi:hypothetical protein
MPAITIHPNSNTATNWTGLPVNSPTSLWKNLDEGVSTADDDVSYSNFSVLSGNILTLGFENPTLSLDQKVLFIRMLIKWRRTTASSTSLSAKLLWTTHGQVQIFDETMILNSSNYFEFSCGTGSCQTPPSESNRFALGNGWTEAEAEDLTVVIEGLDANLRITAIELELGVGYVETGSGGTVLGGTADVVERTARVGVKVGGSVPVIFNEQPLGGILVSPNSSIKDFNDANPFHEGGILIGGSAIEVLFSKKGFLRKSFDINEDIVLTYSGGKLNDTPNASLGGEASPVIIETGINNLFDDITPREADDGQTDYRCFYVFNQHEEETVFNIKTWINTQVEKGADVRLGIEDRDELQSIILDSVPTDGFFTIRYEASNPLSFAPVTVRVPQGLLSPEAYLSEFGQNFQDALRLNPDLRDVIVNASTFGTGILFEVLFEKLDGKREQETLVVGVNELISTTNILIKKVVRGAPINSIASEINQDVTPPGGVIFSVPSNDFPFIIPKLREGEGFHLWVERTISPDDDPIANDGFGLGLSLEPIEPLEVV